MIRLISSNRCGVELAPSWSHGSKCAVREKAQRTPSWLPRGAMDLNRRDDTSVVVSIGWLPRGAMDLNRDPTAEKPDRDGWLPRGAMDLNLQRVDSVQRGHCWLPRGAMDLNLFRCFRQHQQQRWLPRGAMDLNFGKLCVKIQTVVLAPSWSHGSKSRAP